MPLPDRPKKQLVWVGFLLPGRGKKWKGSHRS